MTPASPPPAKIMRIITRLNTGGPAQQALFLTQRLNHGAFSTLLIAGSLGPGDGDMSLLARRRGIPVTFVPALGNGRGIAGDLRALVQLYRLIRREKPAVVHLHLLKARGLGGVAAKLAGTPVVIETLHGHLLQGYYGPARTRLILAIERGIARWIADCIIALSPRQRQDLLNRKVGDAAKIVVVPLGLELQRFLAPPQDPASARRELGIEEDVFLLGAVGRHVPIKGYGVLLQALPAVAREIRQRVLLALVGDGPQRHSLEAEAERLQIRHLVRFLGWRGDVAPLYPAFDLVVQPSFNEGTPAALIEAMAAGRAVIATRVGGVPDVVDDGCSGLLVPPGEPTALAESIVRLWRDPGLRRRLGEEGRRAVCPRYDIDRLVGDLTDLYLRLLAGKAITTDKQSPVALDTTSHVRERSR